MSEEQGRRVGGGRLRTIGAVLLAAVVGIVAVTTLIGIRSGNEASRSGVEPGQEEKVSQDGRWVPRQGAEWQWQLTGDVDLGVSAEIWDLDGETTPRSVIDELRTRGAGVICYLSAGSWESFRADASDFPEEVLGEPLDGWPDERWLDIRRTEVILPIMETRIRSCAEKGFDAVEADNVDAYQSESGFPLTAADQQAFNIGLARIAHENGLAIGLKNDLDQVGVLEPYFDFAINEECVSFDECDRLRPFLDSGKAVLHVEYELEIDEFCSRVPRGFSSMRKRLDLDAWRETCPPEQAGPGGSRA